RAGRPEPGARARQRAHDAAHRRHDDRRRLHELRHADRLRVAAGPERVRPRAGPDRPHRQPPAVSVRRVARRGDDELDALPARVPGLVEDDVDDRRDAGHADQPHGEGRALMDRVTNGMTVKTVLADLTNAAQRLSLTQQRLSSGKQLTKPSDDPVGIGQALQLRSDLATNRQYQRNVEDATSWSQATDDALGQVGDLVLTARELILQGANDAVGTQGRAAIANQLSQLIDSVKAAANTQYAGRYLFAGSATQTPPYKLDNGAATPDDTYYGNTAVMQREIGVGVRVDLNTVGSAVIGDGSSG